jgi:hypothetical protein
MRCVRANGRSALYNPSSTGIVAPTIRSMKMRTARSRRVRASGNSRAAKSMPAPNWPCGTAGRPRAGPAATARWSTEFWHRARSSNWNSCRTALSAPLRDGFAGWAFAGREHASNTYSARCKAPGFMWTNSIRARRISGRCVCVRVWLKSRSPNSGTSASVGGPCSATHSRCGMRVTWSRDGSIRVRRPAPDPCGHAPAGAIERHSTGNGPDPSAQRRPESEPVARDVRVWCR